MNDRDFLCWLHERLEHVYGDHPLVSHMHKLRAIIAETPPNRDTQSMCHGKNSLEELRQHLEGQACPTCAELRVRTSEVRDRLIAEKHLTVSMSCLFGMIEEILKQNDPQSI